MIDNFDSFPTHFLHDREAGGRSDPPSAFKAMINQVLRSEGINVSLIPPDQLASITDQAWRTVRVKFLYESSDDPLNGIAREFFDPTSSSSSQLVGAALAIKQQQRVKLDKPQQEFIVGGGAAGGGSDDIRSIIIEEATAAGVDPALALAIAQQESGLDPNAIGDGGDSVGLFQLNIHGEGYGLTVEERKDPRRNAQIALAEVARVAAQHPDWSPGQIAAAAQRPADRAGYAAAVDALYGPIKAGKLPSGSSKQQTLKELYPEASGAFRSKFGRDPSAAELQDIINATGGNPAAVEQYLRNKPSHIPGLSIGMYQDLSGTANSVSNELFGHGVTDGMVAELAREGKTSDKAIKFWLEQMDIAGKMDPATYAQIWKASQPHMQAVYNETGYDPRISAAVHARWKAANPGAPPPPPSKGTIADAVRAVAHEQEERAESPVASPAREAVRHGQEERSDPPGVFQPDDLASRAWRER